MKIFPIKTGAKFPPLVKKWEHKASDDPEQIAAWRKQFPGCNWGVACGPSDLIVVDEDMPAAILDLELDGITITPTFTVSTPSGGRHLYYRGRCASSIKKLPGIDIKSAGGYVLAPGSKLNSGSEYTIIADLHVVPPHPSFLALLEKAAPESDEPRKTDPACPLDSPSAVLRAKEYADHQAEPSVEGEGGDNNLFRVAAKIRDMGVSEEVCFDILAGRWNERCAPPWDVSDLLAKVRNVFKYAREQPGCANPEADFECLPDDGKPEQLEPFFEHELVGTPPPRDWIIKDWLPQGEVTSLYGDGGQGKTLLAGQLAFAVSRGAPWFGMDTQSMPVLCCMAEDDRGEIHRRVEAYRRHYGSEFSSTSAHLAFFAYPSESYTLMAFESDRPKYGKLYHRLCGWLEAMPDGSKLIILDTLADVFDGNENVRNHANVFVKRLLRSICVKYHATVLLLAHPSRAGISNEDLLSGSTAWNNAVRNRLAIMPHKDISDARWLVRIKSNYARSGDKLLIEYQSGVFVTRHETDMFDELVNGHAELVLQVLQQGVDDGRPFGDTRNHTRPIWERMGLFTNGDGKPMRKETLKRILEELIESGRIERITGSPRRNGLHPILHDCTV